MVTTHVARQRHLRRQRDGACSGAGAGALVHPGWRGHLGAGPVCVAPAVAPAPGGGAPGLRRPAAGPDGAVGVCRRRRRRLRGGAALGRRRHGEVGAGLCLPGHLQGGQPVQPDLLAGYYLSEVIHTTCTTMYCTVHTACPPKTTEHFHCFLIEHQLIVNFFGGAKYEFYILKAILKCILSCSWSFCRTLKTSVSTPRRQNSEKRGNRTLACPPPCSTDTTS